jgi:hypothetical protein
MGIQITGFENAGFYDTLVAMNQPETPLSRGLDKYVGPFLPITPEGRLGKAWAGFPVVGPAALTAQRTLEAARGNLFLELLKQLHHLQLLKQLHQLQLLKQLHQQHP